jgi:hypothetical protein
VRCSVYARTRVIDGIDRLAYPELNHVDPTARPMGVSAPMSLPSATSQREPRLTVQSGRQ